MDVQTWNSHIATLPGAHILQTWEWGKLKEAYGWQMLPKVWQGSDGEIKAAALVLQRTISPGGFAARLRVLYVPRGPLLDWSDQPWRVRVLDDLQLLARKQGAIFIKIDPEVVTARGIPGGADEKQNENGKTLANELARRGWLFSSEQVQFKNTVWLDLTFSEDELLGRMKQKARYNLRLAERKGVKIRAGSQADFPMLYHMYAETSVRDGFVIRPEPYYQSVWQTFMQQGMADALIAEVEGEPIAGLFLFHFAGRAWYLYGMSRQAHRERMPNYLLQWAAIRRAKELGCTNYDLWGAPDEFNETDPMWGVYRFKEGLGGEVARTLGAWDFPARTWLYPLYTRTLPRLLDILRWRGKARTQQEVSL
ncbi:MAG: peptidoglycan bridge formation glycyltransferase FemA/FemB family protein [Anaerolineaceae bacterium]|jgi:lipid II:glycine glycyltransferase (peptidoglycan interpeptide bridge formation enzyme)